MAVQTTQFWQQQLHQLMQVQQLQHQQSLLHQSSSGGGQHHHNLLSCPHQQQLMPTTPQQGGHNNYPNDVNAANGLTPQPPPAPNCSPVCDVIPSAATAASWAMTHPIVCNFANNPNNNCFQPMPTVQPPSPSSLSTCYPVSEPLPMMGFARPPSASPALMSGTAAAHGGTYYAATPYNNNLQQQQQQSVPSHLPAASTAYCCSTDLPQNFPQQHINAFDVLAAGGVASMPHVSSQPAPALVFHQGAHQPQQHQGPAEFHQQQRRADYSSQHSSDTPSQVASLDDEASSALLYCQKFTMTTQPGVVLQPVKEERTVVADPASAVSFTTSSSASLDDGLLPTSVAAEAESGRRLPTRPVSPNAREYYSSPPQQKSSNEHASYNVLVTEGTRRPGVDSSAIAVACSDFSNDEWQVKASPASSSSEKPKHASSCSGRDSKGAKKAGVVTFSVPCPSSDAVHHVVEESSSAVSYCRDVQRHQCCSYPVSDDNLLSDDEDEPPPLPAIRLSDLPKSTKGARRPPRKNDTFCGTAVDDVLNSSWKREAKMQQTAKMPDYLARRATSAD